MKELNYPYRAEEIIRKKKQIKNALLCEKENFTRVKIAILAGSTINEFKDALELFLLNNKIEAEFYMSSYNRYFEEAVFDNNELEEFNPDIVYVFTSMRNQIYDLDLSTEVEIIDKKLDDEFNKYLAIWQSIKEKYNAVIIQNNFEYPNYRVLGNKDIVDAHGFSNYLHKLNNRFYKYANENHGFYICDINYISANYGLSKWHSEKLYSLYKIPCDIYALVDIAYNVSNIIKSIYGKNKKAIALDLDNTIWGNIISEDGIENLSIGPETAEGETFLNFQKYIKKIKSTGILLNIVSKNDEDLALKGIEETDGVLKKDDFVSIKANWEPKSDNIKNISRELDIGEDSFVFIDDNLFERDIVEKNVKGVGIAQITTPDKYIEEVDKAGFFEVTNVSEEDIDRTKKYKEKRDREDYEKSFVDYKEYLKSLEMQKIINPFEEKYYDRISQLTNKSNQFNLTTKRYTISDIKKVSEDKNFITLQGRLIDKFGDNGIVALAIGKIEGSDLYLELFLMSCRVLKRDMEFSMIEKLFEECRKQKLTRIVAEYIKTDRNGMVKDLLGSFGFKKISENKWEYNL